MALTQDQIDDLLVLSRSTQIIAAGYLKVIWDPNDTGEDRYYAESAFQVPPFVGIGVAVEPRLIGSIIKDLEFEIDPDLRAEEIDIVFDDIDKEITGRFRTFGSGRRCSVLFYYPQVAGTHEAWFGQLRAPHVWGLARLKTTITNGYVSSDLLIPGRSHPVNHCSFTFGGALPTAEAVRSNGCPYDLHVGGTTGNFLTGSTPYASCPLSKAACVARLGGDAETPDYYGGFETSVNPIVTDPDTNYPATSVGNASRLSKPVRLTAGRQYMRSIPILEWRRDPNNSPTDPSGWVDVQYEFGEGPVAGIANLKVNDKLIGIHQVLRLGTRGQPQTTYASDIPHYSSTAVGFVKFGQVNPQEYDASNLNAEALITGFSEVASFNAPAGGEVGDAGAGLLATYYSDQVFGSLLGEQIVANINYPLTNTFPIAGVEVNDGWSATYEGTITFGFTQTYTMQSEHTSGVKLTINGSVIINQLASGGGTHTGTFAATAAVAYTFLLEFKKVPVFPIWTAWRNILKWSSASVTLQVVPGTAFAHSGASTSDNIGWSEDRVWWVLTLMSNQKFGMRYSLSSRFNAGSWVLASQILGQYVTHTHDFADGETLSFTGRRSSFNINLEGRPAHEQLTDICRSGKLSLPFQHDGEYHIRAFRPATTDELTDARTFYARGTSKNIYFDDGQPALELSYIPDDELTNEIEVQFLNEVTKNIEEPIFVGDEEQQRRAGAALGDENMLQKVPKTLKAYGVQYLQEAVRVGYFWLWFGEFLDGGLMNNLRVKVTVPYEWTLGLLKYDWIRFPEADLFEGQTIGAGDYETTPEYFQVITMRRLGDNKAEITGQAYNHDATEDFEVSNVQPQVPTPNPPPTTSPPTSDPSPPPTNEPGPQPQPMPDPIPQDMPPRDDLPILATTYSDGYINVEAST